MSPGGASEIRQLIQLPQGQITHATCRAGRVAEAAVLPERYEAFYVLAGAGEIWRRIDDRESITALRPGRVVDIPPGTVFQYRARADASLVFLVVVMPMWEPEGYRTVRGAGPWDVADGSLPPSQALDDRMSRDLPMASTDAAPDGSEIRTLTADRSGSLAHCRLAAGRRSLAMLHRAVHEIWFVTDGYGELWRADGEGEEVVLLRPGVCADIPPGAEFQFAATGAGPLDLVMLTMPPWPGPNEARTASRVYWAPT